MNLNVRAGVYQRGDDQGNGISSFVASRLPHSKFLCWDGLPRQTLLQAFHLPTHTRHASYKATHYPALNHNSETHKSLTPALYSHGKAKSMTVLLLASEVIDSSVRLTDLKSSTMSSPVFFTSSSDIMLRIAAFWYT